MHKFCINQKNDSFDTFAILIICFKISNRLVKLFYPLIFYNITYLYKLPNRPSKFIQLLTLLWLVCLLFEIPNKFDKIFYFLSILQLTLCKLPNKSDAFFCFWIFNGSIICNQLVLFIEYKYRIYNTKVLAVIWFIWLIGLIWKLYSNFCFMAFRRWNFVLDHIARYVMDHVTLTLYIDYIFEIVYNSFDYLKVTFSEIFIIFILFFDHKCYIEPYFIYKVYKFPN